MLTDRQLQGAAAQQLLVSKTLPCRLLGHGWRAGSSWRTAERSRTGCQPPENALPVAARSTGGQHARLLDCQKSLCWAANSRGGALPAAPASILGPHATCPAARRPPLPLPPPSSQQLPGAPRPASPCGWPCARGPPGSPQSTCTPRPAQRGQRVRVCVWECGRNGCSAGGIEFTADEPAASSGPLPAAPHRPARPPRAPPTHLVHPVAVQHAQAAALAAHPLLRHVPQVAGGLQLRHTLVHGLAVHDTLQAESAC